MWRGRWADQRKGGVSWVFSEGVGEAAVQQHVCHKGKDESKSIPIDCPRLEFHTTVQDWTPRTLACPLQSKIWTGLDSPLAAVHPGHGVHWNSR